MTTYDARYSERIEQPGHTRRATVIRADDGRELSGTWFRPTGDVRGAVVLAPAMATPAVFYGAFASWLASSGFATLTFDYRGTGGPAEMRAERGDLIRWAGDAASALETLLDDVPDGVPVTWLGHSLGGQILPWARHDLIDRALLIASSLGYWRWNQPAIRWRSPLLFRVIAPVSIRVAGYYPGKRLGILGDVPPNVMRQWARWCLSPAYFGVDVPDVAARAAEVTVPIDTISFSDDELLALRSNQELEKLYAGATVGPLRVAPADVGVERIGHHGFFRAPMQPLWESLVLPRLAAA